ncbi:MAG: cadherin domain-containing protein, partial [Planctomycetales bacterium]|nr:cadherin domain-containing protein [Planctomycetales bacterium]
TGTSESRSIIALVGTFSNLSPAISDQTFSVLENSAVDTVVGQVIASDDNSGGGFTYVLEDNVEFKIDVTTGEISVAEAVLDTETTPSFALEVTITDFWGETAAATMTINITNVNEYAPVMTLGSALYEIDEFSANGTVIDIAEASDRDAGDIVAFSLAPASPFVIDSVSGIITVGDSGSLAFSDQSQYSLDVIATDSGGLTDTRSIVINLLDLLPTADIVDVSPDPRTTDAGIVTIDFSEAVSGVDIDDFVLTLNDVTVDISSLVVSQVSSREYSMDLSSVTSDSGNYVLRLNSDGSGIVDASGNSLESDAEDSFVVAEPAPQVSEITIDDGTGQRSMIRSITILFDSEIEFDDGAFDLRLADGTLITVATSVAAGTPTNEVVLTFPGYIGGSLEDGNYRLTLLHTHIRNLSGSALDGDGISGESVIDEFFRFFGDIDGDRDVDAIDYAGLRTTYRKSVNDSGYNSVFDYDGDNDVDAADLAMFRERYRTRLDP